MTKNLLKPYSSITKREWELRASIGNDEYERRKQSQIDKIIPNRQSMFVDKQKVWKAFNDYPTLKKTIIEQLFNSLAHPSISIDISRVFDQLVKLGARFDHLYLTNDSLFFHLVMNVLKRDSLTIGYTQALLYNTDFTFEQFTDCADTLLHYGANINGATENHQTGGLLHACFSLEKPFINELIEYFESKRPLKTPNTQFDYEVRDKWGNTAFLLAVHTLQEDTALSLLALNKIGIPIGINDAKKGMGVDGNPGNEQITPLLISAALGMDAVFTELCNQKAIKTRDEHNRGLREYASFNEAELKDLFRGMVFNLERSKKAKHTFLLNLQNKPIYFMGSLLLLSDQTPYKETLEQFIRYLRKENNDEASKLLKHVLRQVKPIKRSKSVLEMCITNQAKLRAKYPQLLEASPHEYKESKVINPHKTASQVVDLSYGRACKISILDIIEFAESNQKITKINFAYNDFHMALKRLQTLLEQFNCLKYPPNKINLAYNSLANKFDKDDEFFQEELGLVFNYLSQFKDLSKLNLSYNSLNNCINLFCKHLRLFSAHKLNLSNNSFDKTAVELILKALSNNIKVLHLAEKALESLSDDYFIDFLTNLRPRANGLEVLHLSDRTIHITTTGITVTRNQPANPSSISSNPSGFFSTFSYPTFRSSSSTDYCPGVASSPTPSSTSSETFSSTTSSISSGSSSSGSSSSSSSSLSQGYSDLDFQTTEEKRPGFGSSF